MTSSRKPVDWTGIRAIHTHNASIIAAGLVAAIAEAYAGREVIYDADLITNAVEAGGVALHWDEGECAHLIRKLNGDAVAAVYADGAYVNGNPL